MRKTQKIDQLSFPKAPTAMTNKQLRGVTGGATVAPCFINPCFVAPCFVVPCFKTITR